MTPELEWQGKIQLKDGRKAYLSARSLNGLIEALQKYRGNLDTLIIERKQIINNETPP